MSEIVEKNRRGQNWPGDRLSYIVYAFIYSCRLTVVRFFLYFRFVSRQYDKSKRLSAWYASHVRTEIP